jgi:hypothetical protein
MFRIPPHVALPLATVVCVGLLACGSSDDSTTDTPTPKPGASTSQSPSVTTIQLSSSPTQTVAATPVGTDNGLCKANASVSIPAPPSPNYTQSVTGGLTCANGIDPTGAIMHAVWHEKAADKTCDSTADATGTASCSRKIAMLTPGYKVVIDVTFGLNGASYATTTSFTPQCCTPAPS